MNNTVHSGESGQGGESAGEREMRALAARLRKRGEQDRSYAVNNALVADLLGPQMAAFEARTGHNLYAVRMAVDHSHSAKRDNAWADDLEAAATALEELATLQTALEQAEEDSASAIRALKTTSNGDVS